MSRVLVLVPFAIDAEGVARRAEQQREVSLREDVTYEYRTVRAGPTSFVSPHDWLLLDLAIYLQHVVVVIITEDILALLDHIEV